MVKVNSKKAHDPYGLTEALNFMREHLVFVLSAAILVGLAMKGSESLVKWLY